MNIFNVRLGFAMNSSSTHSLIFLSKNDDVSDEEVGNFGWNNFTIISKEAKERYLACLLRDNLHHLSNSENRALAKFIFNNMMANSNINLEFDQYNDDHVDHQSMYILPREFGSVDLDKVFFSELSSFFLKENLAVLGGNDNDDYGHPLANNSFILPIPQDTDNFDYVCRKDPEYDFWTLFSQYNGSKIRFTFDSPEAELVPEKASTPELVDLKITDYCNFGCKFCYQGSTTVGKHADKNEIFEYIDTLAKLKVFEVALGGGETTTHPYFCEIVEYIRSKDMIPNFTTKDLSWLDRKNANKVLKVIGGFAYSASSDKDILDLSNKLQQLGISNTKATIQVVLGTMDKQTFKDMVSIAKKERIHLTALGFKTTHRGKTFPKIDYSWFPEALKELKDELSYFSISIDTKVVQEFEDKLLNLDIPRWMMHSKEGKFSCYIDAVEKKIAPSSYCEDKEKISFTSLNKENIIESFKTF